MTRRILLGVLLALILAGQSFATNYYVSAGSGSDSNPGTKTAPWQHVWKACEALQPGDTAFFAGTFQPETHFYEYWTGNITLYPQRSGTENAWITYARWPDSARPVIVGQINTCATDPDCYHSTILNSGTNYIIFDGFETYWGYRGIHISSGHHIIVRNCVSYNSTGGINNNTGNVFLGPGAPDYVTIENNVLHDAHEATATNNYVPGLWNSAGVFAEIEGWDVDNVTLATVDQSLRADHIIVQNNTIYNQGGWGIHLKRMLDTVIVRNNTIYNCAQGMSAAGAGVFCQYNYGNIVYDGSIGIVEMGADRSTYVGSVDIVTFNNTIYNCKNGYAIWTGAKATINSTFNNIFHTCDEYTGQTVAPPSPERLWYDYNNAYNCTGSGHFARFVTNYSTLSSWQSNGISYIHGKDAHSITSDPLFTSAAGHNFTLQAGSPAKTRFLDTTITLWTGEVLSFTEMGAYGVQGGGSSLPRITLVQATDTTTNSVMIRWNTDVATTSRVEYGYTTGYGNLSSLTSTLVTDHAVFLNGLDSSTVYHFRVISSDGEGVTAYSGDYAFRTRDTIPPSPINEIFDPTASPTYGSSGTFNPKVGIVSHPPAVVREPDVLALPEKR